MKRNRTAYWGVGALLGVLCLLFVSERAGAQAAGAAELADFAVVVRTMDGRVTLTCARGCAWNTLSFAATPDSAAQGVDQFGIVANLAERSQEPSAFASFLFTIQRTDDGVELQGKEGSAWSTLRFTCPASGCNQPIDQYGMTVLEPE